MVKGPMPIQRPGEPSEETLSRVLGVDPPAQSPAPTPAPAPAAAPAAAPPPAPSAAPVVELAAQSKETVSVRMSPKTRAIYREVASKVGWSPNQVMAAAAEIQAQILAEVLEKEGVAGVLTRLVRE